MSTVPDGKGAACKAVRSGFDSHSALMDIGDTISLTWKNKRKKQRILEHGVEWIVKDIRQVIGFTSKPGPWILIQSVKTGDLRWVHEIDDDNFVIMVNKLSREALIQQS